MLKVQNNSDLGDIQDMVWSQNTANNVFKKNWRTKDILYKIEILKTNHRHVQIVRKALYVVSSKMFKLQETGFI